MGDFDGLRRLFMTCTTLHHIDRASPRGRVGSCTLYSDTARGLGHQEADQGKEKEAIPLSRGAGGTLRGRGRVRKGNREGEKEGRGEEARALPGGCWRRRAESPRDGPCRWTPGLHADSPATTPEADTASRSSLTVLHWRKREYTKHRS